MLSHEHARTGKRKPRKGGFSPRARASFFGESTKESDSPAPKQENSPIPRSGRRQIPLQISEQIRTVGLATIVAQTILECAPLDKDLNRDKHLFEACYQFSEAIVKKIGVLETQKRISKSTRFFEGQELLERLDKFTTVATQASGVLGSRFNGTSMLNERKDALLKQVQNEFRDLVTSSSPSVATSVKKKAERTIETEKELADKNKEEALKKEAGIPMPKRSFPDTLFQLCTGVVVKKNAVKNEGTLFSLSSQASDILDESIFLFCALETLDEINVCTNHDCKKELAEVYLNL
jgi:hypothetical protein